MDVVVQQVLQCLRRKDIPPEMIVGTDAKYVLMLLRMMPYNIIDFLMRIAYPPIPAIMKMTKKATVQQWYNGSIDSVTVIQIFSVAQCNYSNYLINVCLFLRLLKISII